MCHKEYKEFLLEELVHKDFYRFVMNDIHIYMDVVMNALDKEFKMKCWFLYSGENSVSLGYFQSSDDSNENIMKIKKFLFDKFPYFRDISCYDDDKRLVLKFVDVGDPVKFKFYL